MRGKLFPVLVACCSLAAAFPLRAQTPDYPTRPITLVVPFAAGGFVDTVARHFSAAMSRKLAQNLIIENRPGGGTALAASVVLSANPDGYTLLYAVTGAMTLLPLLPPKPNFDPDRDFLPIGSVEEQPMMIVTSDKTGIQSLAALVLAAKSDPGRMSFASSGRGTETQFLIEMLKRDAGVEMTHVPYRGSAAAIPDMLAGRIELGAFSLSSVRPFFNGSGLTPLAVLSARRLPDLPEVPNIVEIGYPKLINSARTGLFASTRTPRAVIERLETAMAGFKDDETFVRALKGIGSELSVLDHAAFEKLLKDERKMWTEVVENLKY